MNDWSEAAVWLLLRLEDNPQKKALEEFLDYVLLHHGLTTVSYVGPSQSICLIKNPCIAMAYSDALIEHYEATNGTRNQDSTESVDWTFLPKFETLMRCMLAEPNSGIGRNSLTISVYGPRGPQALLILTSNENPDAWQIRRHNLAISLTRVAYYFHSCVNRLQRDETAVNFKPLNTREMEALTLASHGKSVTEVALVMRSSKSAVSAHLDSARHKLSALNLNHAVWKAVSSGLID